MNFANHKSTFLPKHGAPGFVLDTEFFAPNGVIEGKLLDVIERVFNRGFDIQVDAARSEILIKANPDA